MRTAFLLMVLVGSALAQITIQPTTTLTDLTGNNTSAADSFSLTSNGNARPGNVSKVSVRELMPSSFNGKVIVAMMGWWGKQGHPEVGYLSNDPSQIAKQMADMKSRGIDGMNIAWFGVADTLDDETAAEWLRQAELDGQFTVAVRVNKKVVEKRPIGQSETDAVITQLQYVAGKYFQSPAYMRIDARPVVMEFGLEAFNIDWNRVRANVPGNPVYIRRNAASLDGSRFSDGGFAWGASSALSYYDYFNRMALKYDSKISFAGANKGFDDSIAAWSQNEFVSQECGMRWLNTFKNFSTWFATSSVQPDAMHLVTWNDFEEGTALETGIDNCLTVSASIASKVLTWSLVGSGSEETIHHYEVYVSKDGQNLMHLTQKNAGDRTLDLSGYSFADGTYHFLVRAVAKPGILNKMSNAATYTVYTPPPPPPPAPAPAPSPCPLPTITGVKICSPTTSTTGSSVRVLSSVKVPSGRRVTGFSAYLDGVQVYRTEASTMDVTIPVGSGSHRLQTKAWDNTGASYRAEVAFGETSAPTPSCDRPANGIVLCTPLPSATTSTSVYVKALAGSAYPITGVTVYVDNSIAYSTTLSSTVDRTISISRGTHRITVQAWNSLGTVYKDYADITVK